MDSLHRVDQKVSLPHCEEFQITLVRTSTLNTLPTCDTYPAGCNMCDSRDFPFAEQIGFVLTFSTDTDEVFCYLQPLEHKSDILSLSRPPVCWGATILAETL